MFNKPTPSPNCFHSKDGICSKCVLHVAFNLSTISQPAPSPTTASLTRQQLDAEFEFVKTLVDIGHRLRNLPSKEAKSKQLICELYDLNWKLPARLWLPIYADRCPHLVLRIPYSAGCVLNSKDKVPYCIYVEVLVVEDVCSSELPLKAEDNFSDRISSPAGTSAIARNDDDGGEDENGDEDSDPIADTDNTTVSSVIGERRSLEENGITASHSSEELSFTENDTASSQNSGSARESDSRECDCENDTVFESSTENDDEISRNSESKGEAHTVTENLESSREDARLTESAQDKETTVSDNSFGALNGGRSSSSASNSRRSKRQSLNGASTASLPKSISLPLSIPSNTPVCGFDLPSPSSLNIPEIPDSFLLLSPKSTRRRRQQIEHTAEDPSASTMSEPWDEKEARIRNSSPYGHLPNWRLMAVIVKTGDDLRQELLAYQLLTTLQSIWDEEKVPLYLRPYRIFICSHNSGFIEPIPNACSLHQIKKNLSIAPHHDDAGQPYPPTLLSHFFISYGSRHTKNFMRAQLNFVRSCAAYCLVCYFLQVKDRHNGNILLDHDGHLIHIDFEYILSMSPRNLGFETSPFKLTQELIDVMFGMKSDMYAHFKSLMLQGLLAARKHHQRLINIVEIMINGSQLPCFRGGQNVLRLMRDRFHLSYPDAELQNLVDMMVEQSRDSLTTRLYDNFQYYTNGIF